MKISDQPAATSHTRRPPQLPQLQSLRFLAAFLVLFGHVLMEARQHGTFIPAALYDLPWGIGVDIFFVISGFIIAYIGRNIPSGVAAAGDFLMRRIIRIAPLYWLFTLLMVATILVVPSRLQHADLSIADLLRSLLFIPYSAPGETGFRPVLEQGWTLNFEMFFYLLFSLVIVFTRRRILVSSAFLLALVLGSAALPIDGALAYLFGPLLILFCAGLTMAHLHNRLPGHGGRTAFLITAAAITWFALVPAPADEQDLWLRLLHRGIPAIALVHAAVMWRKPAGWTSRGPIPFLGDASYSLYLSHPFAVNATLIAFQLAGLSAGAWFIFAATVLAVLASAVVHLMVEKPMLKACTSIYRRRAASERNAISPVPATATVRPESW